MEFRHGRRLGVGNLNHGAVTQCSALIRSRRSPYGLGASAVQACFGVGIPYTRIPIFLGIHGNTVDCARISGGRPAGRNMPANYAPSFDTRTAGVDNRRIKMKFEAKLSPENAGPRRGLVCVTRQSRLHRGLSRETSKPYIFNMLSTRTVFAASCFPLNITKILRVSAGTTYFSLPRHPTANVLHHGRRRECPRGL